MGKYLTKIGLTKYTTKLKEYISKAKVASAASADNAIKVNNHTVNADVPANAKFTDTDTWRPQPDWNATSGDAAIKNKPTSMPASDVYAWAKASTKPTYSKSEVGLGEVDNTADANKSVKSSTKLQTYKQGSTTETYGDEYPIYAQWENPTNVRLKCDDYTVKTDFAYRTDNANYAATAGSANSVTWSNISEKPTLGNAASKTTRGLNGIGTCGWAGGEIDKDYVPDMTFMAWWNGAYSETASNLAYCNKGAFGTAATANKGDFATASHTHNYLPLSGGVIKNNVGDSTINPGQLIIHNDDGTITINGHGISDSGSDCWHELKGLLQVGQIETINGSPIIDIRNGTTNEGHTWSAVILRNGYDRYAYCIMNIRMKLQLGGLWMTLPFNFANSDYNVTVSRQFDSYCSAVPNNIASLSQYVSRTKNYFRINTGGTGDTMYNAYNYGESDDAFFVTITGEVPY